MRVDEAAGYVRPTAALPEDSATCTYALTAAMKDPSNSSRCGRVNNAEPRRTMPRNSTNKGLTCGDDVGPSE